MHREIGSQSGDTNLFGYVLGDPVNFIDPTGEAAIDVIQRRAENYIAWPWLTPAERCKLESILDAHDEIEKEIEDNPDLQKNKPAPPKTSPPVDHTPKPGVPTKRNTNA